MPDHRARTWLQDLVMPPPTCPPNLLERLVALTHLPWPLAGLAAGLGPYLLLIVTAVALRLAPVLAANRAWYYALRPALLTAYLVLVYPLLKRALRQTLEISRALLPPAQDNERWLAEAYGMGRRGELVAVCLGAAIGWFLTEPWQQGPGWFIAYKVLSEGLLFGLLGWMLYWAGTRTEFLAAWREDRGALLPRAGLQRPRARWRRAVLLALLGGVILGLPFIRPGQWLSPDRLLFSIALLLAGALAFLWSSIPLALLARFRIARAFGLLVLALLAGTLGYSRIEGWPLLDSLYMTVITMTTIGFSEIRPLDQAGQIFTIFLSLAAVGIAGYAITTVATFVLEGDLQQMLRGRRMDKQIAQMDRHIILCGAGRVGYQVALELYKTRSPFVLIEDNPEALERVRAIGQVLYVEGSAMQDDTLRRAGIDRARGLIATLSDDKDNAFVVLSARSLNPDLRIIARLADEENAEKLRRAGADEVVSPNAIGGLRMASLLIRPVVVSFLDEMIRSPGYTLRVEEAPLAADSHLLHKTLGEAAIGQRTGALVVAIKSQDGQYRFNPNAQTQLQSGDVLIVIGTPEQIATLRETQLDLS